MALPLLNVLRSTEPTYRTFSRRTQLPLQAEQMWRIESGIVRTFTWLEDGCLVTLGFWGAGDVLGKALSRVTTPYHAECLTDVKAIPLSPDQWHQETNALIEHIRQSGELLEILHCSQTEVSLLRALNWLAKRFGQDSHTGRRIDFRLTHQELAELIGATRVTVTRMLNDFEKRGLIHRQRRSITVVPEQSPFWHYEI
ncbi:Crp/Fnr family transcriptional regulator [Oculatella sp. LEGE 06141]|uniref:Crp/Fnr family transcriptional regulator n=1 Tax=Oculatella sp. LEGE 06141 TaxID=1828648 RepID=UPI00187F5711|nr:Crp/Fnr family transcriptional regulator [Oculatella sp. LEGE 06141]MBE9178933.1 Crp/Fnr family transcriptional regulator [Oculatella sp. LEGE 06141]